MRTKRRGASRKGYRTGTMLQIARERITSLFESADRAALVARTDLADRYVQLARRIGMRYNLRLARDQKLKFCPACYAYLRPGTSARVRVRAGRLVITCVRCGACRRLPLHTPAPRALPTPAGTVPEGAAADPDPTSTEIPNDPQS